MNSLHLTLSALIVCVHGLNGLNLTPNTKVLYQWKKLEFSFPTNDDRQRAIDSGNLIPENAIPIDVQPDYFSRTFVTIPKFQNGIPYTLATVSEDANGPVLKPYPNYGMHNNNNGTNCDAITSAFRVMINECNQMWVIDSGMVGSDAQCPPQLLLFDLKSDTLIHRYRFEKSVYIPVASLFITPVVVVNDPPPTGSCRQTMVYVADCKYHGLVVYNFEQNDAWRIENMFMHPDPNYGLLSVAGDSFVLMDGILGMATDKQNLYFHPLSSATEYSVPLKVIDNSSLFKQNIENMPDEFNPLGVRENGACAASAMDSKNNLYCVTLNPIELIMWNVNTPYNNLNIEKLFVEPELLQFVSGMKVVKNRQGKEELWMLSNRFQKLATGTQDFNEVNFRIVVLSDIFEEDESYFPFSQFGFPEKKSFFSKTRRTNYFK